MGWSGGSIRGRCPRCGAGRGREFVVLGRHLAELGAAVMRPKGDSAEDARGTLGAQYIEPLQGSERRALRYPFRLLGLALASLIFGSDGI